MAQDPSTKTQDSDQAKRQASSYSPRQHMDGERSSSPKPCLTNSLLIGVDKRGSKRDGDQTPTLVVGLSVAACLSIFCPQLPSATN